MIVTGQRTCQCRRAPACLWMVLAARDIATEALCVAIGARPYALLPPPPPLSLSPHPFLRSLREGHPRQMARLDPLQHPLLLRQKGCGRGGNAQVRVVLWGGGGMPRCWRGAVLERHCGGGGVGTPPARRRGRALGCGVISTFFGEGSGSMARHNRLPRSVCQAHAMPTATPTSPPSPSRSSPAPFPPRPPLPPFPAPLEKASCAPQGKGSWL